MAIVEVETWNVTELSTHEDRFDNDIEEILYGDDYTKHVFKTQDEAVACEQALNTKGIKTNLTHVFRQERVAN